MSMSMTYRVAATNDAEHTLYPGGWVSPLRWNFDDNGNTGDFTFTVGGETTAVLNESSTVGAVEAALEALSTVNDVTVTGAAGTFTIVFNDTTLGVPLKHSDISADLSLIAGAHFRPQGDIWLASGVIESIEMNSDSTDDGLEVTIYNAITDGGQPFHNVTDADAWGERSGYEHGYDIFEPWTQAAAGGTLPSAFVNNGIVFRQDVAHDDGTTVTRVNTRLEPFVHCPFGMAIRLDTSGALGMQLDVNVRYRPFTLGGHRYNALGHQNETSLSR